MMVLEAYYYISQDLHPFYLSVGLLILTTGPCHAPDSSRQEMFSRRLKVSRQLDTMVDGFD